MISVELAKRLRSAGLRWEPRRFDFFHIPDRDLDDETFVIADLLVDVQRVADGIAAITFNGAVEWSLDYIFTQDVVWLPTETQARRLLGDSLVSLLHTDDGYVCTVSTESGDRTFEARAAADAYGHALLDALERGRAPMSGGAWIG